MKVAEAASAIIPRRKVEDYLLCLAYPIGGAKARFFIHFGFRREQWEVLANALLEHAQISFVTDAITDSSGTVYVIEGEMNTPLGRRSRVRTIEPSEIWIDRRRRGRSHSCLQRR